jgi:hypothetical protein
VWRGQGERPITAKDFLAPKTPENATEEELAEEFLKVFGELGNLQVAN